MLRFRFKFSSLCLLFAFDHTVGFIAHRFLCPQELKFDQNGHHRLIADVAFEKIAVLHQGDGLYGDAFSGDVSGFIVKVRKELGALEDFFW